MRSLLVLLSFVPALALAQPDARTLGAAERTGEIQLDGLLDEAAWNAAPAADGFVQQDPDPGADASEPTTVRVLYDDRALWIAARLEDRTPEAIEAPLARRDADLASDWFWVGLDPYTDRRTGYEFGVNPAGVRRDALLYNDTGRDAGWNGIWDAAVRRDDGGWTVEMRIPLSQLRFASGVGSQTWGIQFGRTLVRRGEQSHWSPVDNEVEGHVSQFGSLEGLEGLSPPRRMELRPYVAASVQRAPGDASDPFYSPTEAAPNVGLDAQLGLTSNLTLTATLNPDFGQVEADPDQVNLTAFELAFDERRPFFVEGTDVFSFGRIRSFVFMNRAQLLYTRRIGRSPQLRGFVPGDLPGTVYTDAPGQTTILGAVKLTGRVGDVSVGVLDAITAPEYGRYASVDAAGTPRVEDRALVEPLSNYAVGRAQYQTGTTTVGGLLTAVHRRTDDPAMGALLPASAYVVGLDAEHAWGGREWLLGGQVSASRVGGSAASLQRLQRAPTRYYQRPDAAHLDVDLGRAALTGWSAEASLAKVGGTHWLGSLRAQAVSPGFEVNDLGFQTRADLARVGSGILYRDLEPDDTLRYWYTQLFATSGWNWGGDRIEGFLGWMVRPVFRSGLELRFVPLVEFARTDDRLTRGGPLARQPVRGEFYHEGSTDAFGQRPVAVGWRAYLSRDRAGQTFTNGGLELRMRPSPALEVTLEPGVQHRRQTQYVRAVEAPEAAATFGQRYVFGSLEQTTLSVAAQVDWTFTPDLSLQLFARPFISSGTYQGFRELAAPRTFDFTVYGADRGTVSRAEGTITVDPGDGGAAFSFASPDFLVRSLQGNAILRWEYRPGSVFFLVWQQQRRGAGSGGLDDRNLVRVFTDPVENVFLAKVSYRIGA